MWLSFPLFRTQHDLALQYWTQLLKPGDWVVDATCGNGKDTLKLAKLILPSGKLWAIDLQEEAIAATRDLLYKEFGIPPNIQLIKGSHENFPSEIGPESTALIVYNLGYLPKGDKSFTTMASSTLTSLKKGADLIRPGGAICITCYPGHQEGKSEETAILEWARTLPPWFWNVTYQRWENRNEAPSMILIQRGF